MTLQCSNNQFNLLANNGSSLKIVPAFDKDRSLLKFLDGVNVLRIIKKQSKAEFKSKKDNKTKHYYNFYLVTESNKSIQIKCLNNEDIRILDCISEYVK